MDNADHASRFNNFLSIPHKQGIADIQPKVISQQTLGQGALTIAQLSTSSYSSSNLPSTLVFRDSNGNFSANTITGKTTGNEMPLTFNAPFSRSVNTISYSGDLPLSAHNVVTDTSTGSQIATATGQKLAFHGSTPVIQRSGAAQAAVATTGSTQTTPFGYTTAAQADSIVTLLNEIRAALVEKGIIKGSA